MLSAIKKWFARNPENKEELIDFLRQAKLQSLIESSALLMIESILNLTDLRVRDILIPKQQMVCLQDHDTLKTIINTVTQSGHSRFPVLDDNHAVIGILHAKDLLQYYYKPEQFDIYDIIRPPKIIPESKRLDLLLGEFRIHRNHMAQIVDEYGHPVGFVTIEDIIEQIIGDIEDEFDTQEESYIKTHGHRHTIIKAHIPIDIFNENFHAQLDETQYDTLGGLLAATFGHLPKRGETITLDGFLFKILHADARRIKLLDCCDQRPEARSL